MWGARKMNTEFFLFEGARGTGKSTLTQQLRQTMKNTTLINFTGFNMDGDKGLTNVSKYYFNWLSLFYSMKNDEVEQTIICDRFFFSEKVFSHLYKDYDFSDKYNGLISLLECLKPTIFFFTVNDEEELSKRLQRDKIPFHNVEESVKETMKQQEEYVKVFGKLQNVFNIITIDTTHLTQEQVRDVVISHM
jgi:deoxyguanosine kinase